MMVTQVLQTMMLMTANAEDRNDDKNHKNYKILLNSCVKGKPNTLSRPSPCIAPHMYVHRHRHMRKGMAYIYNNVIITMTRILIVII